MKLSIVLPCYNEAANLPLLLAEYAEVWQALPAELILVDNGSTDDTQPVLTGLLAKPEYAFARSVKVDVNRGYGHGIATGLNAARGEFLAYSHADMQCSPRDPFRAFEQLQETRNPQSSLVKGVRARRPLGDEIVTAGMSLYSSCMLRMILTDINAQPKVFPRALLERMSRPPDGFEFDLYVLVRAKDTGMTVSTLPVEFGERAHGTSKWKFSLFSRWRTILRVMRYTAGLAFDRERA